MKREELDKLVDIALLDLHTLNEWSIQTNPERVKRPILAIEELSKRLDWYEKKYPGPYEGEV